MRVGEVTVPVVTVLVVVGGSLLAPVLGPYTRETVRVPDTGGNVAFFSFCLAAGGF